MANTNYVVLIQQSNTGISVEAPIPDSFAFDVGASYEQMLPQGLLGNQVLNIAAAATGTRLAVQAFTAQLWAGNTESDLSVEVEFHTETDPIADVRTPIVNLLKLTMPSISSSSGFLNSPGPQIDWTQGGQILVNALGSISSSVSSVVGGIETAASNVYQGAKAALTGTTPKPGNLNNSSTTANTGANNPLQQALTQNPGLGSAAYWKSRIKNQITIRVGNYLYFDSVVITKVSQTFASNFDAQTGLPHNVRVAIAFKPLFMLTQEDLNTLFVNPQSNSTSSNASFGTSMVKSVVANAIGSFI